MLCPIVKKASLPELKTAGNDAKAATPIVVDNDDGTYSVEYLDVGGRRMQNGIQSTSPNVITVDGFISSRFSVKAHAAGGGTVIVPSGPFIVTIPFTVKDIDGGFRPITPGQPTYELAPFIAPVEKPHATQPKGFPGIEHQRVSQGTDLRGDQTQGRQESRRPAGGSGG